jgi:hypothetical protein
VAAHTPPALGALAPAPIRSASAPPALASGGLGLGGVRPPQAAARHSSGLRLPVGGPQQARASSATSQTPALIDRLRNDPSRLALRPADPAFLERIASQLAAVADVSNAVSTLHGDDLEWPRWKDFCNNLMGTDEWRNDAAANNGTDVLGHEREVFLHAAYLLHRWNTMIPRSRASPAPKPASARSALNAVRRIHARAGHTTPATPAITRLVNGLCRMYVRAHGPYSLMPDRKEPLTTPIIRLMLAAPAGSPGGMRRRVNWLEVYFVSWRAFVLTTRHTGARKADLLDVVAAEFSAGSMTRANLKWRINGVVYAAPSDEMLRALKDGDAAVLIPSCCKNDPFGMHFGDSPIYLPVVVGDDTNAALALRDLELALPAPGALRPRLPLFAADASHTPMSHADADATFDALAKTTLDPAVAKTISLHSGRVWLACALFAARHAPGVIQRMVRWRSPESIAIYAHTEPDEYMRVIRSAIAMDVTSTLARNMRENGPVTDYDDAVASWAASSDEPGDGAQRQKAARAADAPPPAATASGGSAPDSAATARRSPPDPSVLARAGGVIARDDVTAGTAVAVVFDFDDGAAYPFRGDVVRVLRTSARVRFADGGTLDVAFNQLLRITGSYEP